MYFKRKHVVANASVKMTIQQAHEKLGHFGEDAARATSSVLGWRITRGRLVPCDACAAAKAKQKNVPRTSRNHEKASKEAGRIFLDNTTIKGPDKENTVTKPNWRIMVDKRANLKFTDFFATKDGMVEPTCVQLNKWNQAKFAVRWIRLDNPGENKKLQEMSESANWKLGFTFEYTVRDTPQ
jgi:hypothetical protein